MKSKEHRKFHILVRREGDRFYAEIYRKDKLIHTVSHSAEMGGALRSGLAAIESAKDWIDHTYPVGRVIYYGEI